MKRGLGLLGGAVVVSAGLFWFGVAPSPGSSDSGEGAAPAAVDAGSLDAGSIDSLIAADQGRLRQRPDDADAWARLGTSYVEKSRLTADPTYLTKSEGALRRSLRLRDRGSNATALYGLGALALARHEFAEARGLARQALRLQGDHWAAYGVLSDAELQLGDYAAAEAALQRMMDLRPGLPAYLRTAHWLALTGRHRRAGAVLELAASAATTRADKALCAYRQGELAWSRGDLDRAETFYLRALAADPNSAPALAGRGKVRAARGESASAVADYRRAVEIAPQPALVLELGDLYASLGGHAEAEEQYGLFRAEQRLFAAGGVTDWVVGGRYETEHGDPARAVRELRAQWKAAPSVDVADALGWALHRAGRDREALAMARRAMRLGGYPASFAYHRGEIERALGDTRAARRHLDAALRQNPRFSPLYAPRARAAYAMVAKQ